MIIYNQPYFVKINFISEFIEDIVSPIPKGILLTVHRVSVKELGFCVSKQHDTSMCFAVQGPNYKFKTLKNKQCKYLLI